MVQVALNSAIYDQCISISVYVCFFFFFFAVQSSVFYILHNIVQGSKMPPKYMHEQVSYMPSRHRLESHICLGVIDRESIKPRLQ